MGGRRTQRKRKETSDIAVVDGVEVGDNNVGGDSLVTTKIPKKIKGDKDVAPIVVVGEEDKDKSNDNETDGDKSEKKGDDANVAMLDEVKAKTMEVVEQSTVFSSEEAGEEKDVGVDDDEDDGINREGKVEQITLCSVTGSSNEEIHEKIKDLLVCNMGAKIFDMLLEDGAHSVHHLANNLSTVRSNPTFFYVWKQLLSLGIVKESPMHSQISPKPVYRLTSAVFPFGKPASAKKLASTEEGDFRPMKCANKKTKAKAASKDGNSDVENEKGEGSEDHTEAPGTEAATATAASSSPTEASEIEEGEIIEAVI